MAEDSNTLGSENLNETEPVGGITLRKNAIGLPEVLFQSITSMAPATAVTAALTPAIPYAGASLPLAVLLATVACAFIAFNIGQLAIHIPSAGGLYTYISRGLGAKVGFLSAWIFLIAQPLLLPLVAVVWGPVAEDLFKSLTGIDIPWYIWIVVGSILLLALTYYGIRLSTEANLILGSIELAIILVLSLVIIVTAGSHNNLATFTTALSANKGGGGWLGIWQGIIFAFLAFLGFEAAAPLGEETTHPKRNIPLAVIYSSIGIGLFYVLASYAGVIGWGTTKLGSYVTAANPWVDLSSHYWGAIGPVIISFAVINSSLGNGNAGINATSRVTYAMARAGTLPAVFGRLTRHQTPGFGIIVHVTVATIVAIVTGFILGPTNAFALIGTILTLGFLLLYIASCIATFAFYRRERPQEFRIWKHVILPLIPTVILLFPLVVQVYPVPPFPINLSLPILLVWIFLGAVFLVSLIRTRPEALERGKEIFLQDTLDATA